MPNPKPSTTVCHHLPPAGARAGSTTPLHSPNPILSPSLPSHHPLIMTSSPSSRYLRCRVAPLLPLLPEPASAAPDPAGLVSAASPPAAGSTSGCAPPRVISSRHARESGVGPLIVPLPSRSPGRRLQPPHVWCATIWGHVQYMWRRLEAQTRVARCAPAGSRSTATRTSCATRTHGVWPSAPAACVPPQPPLPPCSPGSDR
mmetsp:Transcript_22810/g.58052  ORF Transcript_22810/g.58052 Transcript_22810/m.58052 type:complete len:202 (-) Transcript_22810:949-1554(-)